MNKTLLPQEIETFYILPTMRRYLTLYLKEKGMKQKDIAEIFGVNTAAVSQYEKKRGHKLEFGPEVLTEIKNSAHLIKDQFTYLRETQRLLRFIRKTKVLCQVHRKFSDTALPCNSQKSCCPS